MPQLTREIAKQVGARCEREKRNRPVPVTLTVGEIDHTVVLIGDWGWGTNGARLATTAGRLAKSPARYDRLTIDDETLAYLEELGKRTETLPSQELLNRRETARNVLGQYQDRLHRCEPRGRQ